MDDRDDLLAPDVPPAGEVDVRDDAELAARAEDDPAEPGLELPEQWGLTPPG